MGTERGRRCHDYRSRAAGNAAIDQAKSNERLSKPNRIGDQHSAPRRQDLFRPLDGVLLKRGQFEAGRAQPGPPVAPVPLVIRFSTEQREDAVRGNGRRHNA